MRVRKIKILRERMGTGGEVIGEGLTSKKSPRRVRKPVGPNGSWGTFLGSGAEGRTLWGHNSAAACCLHCRLLRFADLGYLKMFH